MLRTSDPLNAFLDHSDAPVKSAGTGTLSGKKLAVKDIFDVAGHRSGWGNPQRLAEAAPASVTSLAIQALMDEGAQITGRTQTEELAFSLTGHNAHYPQPVNPAAPDRVTGGSSSGSAAAVAGGLADIAIGSDTGGSIRAPASFCGLIGLRPTHGRISLEGAMPLAPSLDTFGWFARDIDLYEKVATVLLGTATPTLARPMRIEVLETLLLGPREAEEYSRMAMRVAGCLGDLGAAPAFSHAIDDLYWSFRIIQAHEAWGSHGKWLSAADRGLGPGVRERFDFGASVTKDDLAKASARRDAFRAELAELLAEDGFVVLPTVPGAAPMRDAGFDDLQAYRERALRLLCIAGLAGLPQITIPIGTVDGAPFGISLMGPAGSDMALISLARMIIETNEGH
ncbi:amidase [Mesorhizobium sp. CAU 1741]|uniref:amidase n=1 Tax=Mesorhizobium sp. CAU 1741 TaxID=3140366 RepID=UPI00325C2E3A